MARRILLILLCSFFIPACVISAQLNFTESMQSNYTASLQFKQIHAKFAKKSPFLTLYNLALNKCVFECQVRSECQAVNFWVRRRQCQLLANDTTWLDRAPAGHPCTYVRKSDVKEAPALRLSSICPPCNSGTESCDVETGQCVFRECRRNTEPNSTYVGNALTAGSRIVISCYQWFVPTTFVYGRSPYRHRSVCQDSDGLWGPVPPCVFLFECGIPPEFPNARANHYTYEGGDPSAETVVAVYLCLSGYAAPDISNDMTLDCNFDISNVTGDTENITWAEPEFTCIRDCGEPDDKPDARVSEGENLENMTKAYYCSPGYELNVTGTWNQTMELTTMCEPNGTWTSVNFECLPICGHTPGIPYGYTKELFTVGNSTFLEYTCRENYTMADPYTDTPVDVECLNGTAWEEPYFYCVRDCFDPPNVTTPNSTLLPGSTLEDTVRVYTCGPGLVVIGNGTTTCLPTGDWTELNFWCVGVCEVPPTVPNAMNISFTNTGTVSTAEYSCETGYSFSSAATGTTAITLTCQNAGPWSNQSDTCVPGCLEPPDITASIANAVLVNGSGTHEGATRYYGCKTGYSVNGTSRTRCEPSGTWTAVNFNCAPECETPATVPNAANVGFVTDGSMATAIYSCNWGYSLVTPGNITLICNYPGPWDVLTDTCLKDCSAPPDVENATISTGNTLEGTTRNYTCDVGFFVPVGETAATTCQMDGSWTPTIAQCTPECSVVEMLPNAIYTYFTDNGSISTARYSCNTGYSLATAGYTSITRTCSYPGPWSAPSDTCLRDCYQPPAIADATVSAGATLQATLQGTTRSYTCHPGFYVNGTTAASTTCQADGNWTSPMFYCDTVCGPVPAIANGSLVGTTTDGNWTFLKYTCEVGYVKLSDHHNNSNNNSNNTDVECVNGTWDETYLGCLKNCSTPPVILNVNVTVLTAAMLDGGTIEGTFIQYTCNTGFVLNGSGTMTCQPDGNWLGDVECLADCSNPPIVANSTANATPVGFGSRLEGAVVTYTCTEGYVMNGTDVVTGSTTGTSTCQPDGKWTPVAFQCVSVCAIPPSIQHGVLADPFIHIFNESTTAWYYCISGYMPTSMISAACNHPGPWTGPYGMCIRVCGVPPLVPHLEVFNFQTDPSMSTATVSCAAGFSFPSLPADRSVMCEGQGPWSVPTEPCLIECPDPPPDKEFMTVSNGGYLEGATRNYSCLPGYTSNHMGPMSVMCQSYGVWTEGNFTCEPKAGWSVFEGIHSFLDESVTIRADQDNFVTYCQTYVDPNSYMLHVETVEKQALVERMLQNSTASSWCLGLHSAASDNIWVWSGTGAALNFSNWASGQGDDSQPYVRMDTSYKWRDTDSFACTPVCELP